MAHTRRRPDLDARLIRIEFPWMGVKRYGLSLDAVDPFDAPFGPAVRELPEIPAPGDRHVDATEPDRRSGYFQKRAACAPQYVGMPRRIGNAVAIVVDRKNARVVGEALFDQDVERPEARRDH